MTSFNGLIWKVTNFLFSRCWPALVVAQICAGGGFGAKQGDGIGLDDAAQVISHVEAAHIHVSLTKLSHDVAAQNTQHAEMNSRLGAIAISGLIQGLVERSGGAVTTDTTSIGISSQAPADTKGAPTAWLNATDLADRRILVVGKFMTYKTGGPEALGQLALALHAVAPDRTGWSGVSPIDERFQEEYPGLMAIPDKELSWLRPGDIFITSEGDAERCQLDLVHRGVHMFNWQLAVNENSGRNGQQGCGQISHAFFLSHFPYVPIDLPETSVIRPYITPSIVADSEGALSHTKEDLILIDDDVPGGVTDAIETACSSTTGCKVWKASLFGTKTRKELAQLYRRAKIVVDWCMIGAERVPLEACLYGAALVTNHCRGGGDQQDFPIPKRNILTDREAHDRQLPADFQEVIQRIFANYEQEQRDYAPLRSLYRGLNGISMANEVHMWLKAMGKLSDRTVSMRAHYEVPV
jgi:hypothetical protein